MLHEFNRRTLLVSFSVKRLQFMGLSWQSLCRRRFLKHLKEWNRAFTADMVCSLQASRLDSRICVAGESESISSEQREFTAY